MSGRAIASPMSCHGDVPKSPRAISSRYAVGRRAFRKTVEFSPAPLSERRLRASPAAAHSAAAAMEAIHDAVEFRLVADRRRARRYNTLRLYHDATAAGPSAQLFRIASAKTGSGKRRPGQGAERRGHALSFVYLPEAHSLPVITIGRLDRLQLVQPILHTGKRSPSSAQLGMPAPATWSDPPPDAARRLRPYSGPAVAVDLKAEAHDKTAQQNN